MLTKTRPLNTQQIDEIIKTIVFRNTTITYNPMIVKPPPFDSNVPVSGSKYGRVFFSRPCVFREYDRKLPEQKYKTVDDYKDHMEWTWSESSSPYGTYKYNGRYVSKLEGWHWVPEFFNEDDLTRWIIDKLIWMEVHEIQENFYVSGERKYDPHIVGEFVNR